MAEIELAKKMFTEVILIGDTKNKQESKIIYE